jgi:hypothetical protein
MYVLNSKIGIVIGVELLKYFYEPYIYYCSVSEIKVETEI